MFVLLVAAVALIQGLIRMIAGKGIVLTFSLLILSIVVIDCELAYILGQLELTPLNVVLIYGPGISITLGIIYLLFRIVVLPVRALTQTAARMAQGDLQGELTYRNNNEIGTLALGLADVITYQREMVRLANQIARGELWESVQKKSERDELGQAFADMTAQLNRTIRQVTDNAAGLGSAAQQLAEISSLASQSTNQIAMTVQQVAKGTTQQNESITKTVQSVDQMGRIIDGVAHGAQNQTRAVGQAAEITNQISTVIQEVAANARAGAQGSEKATAAAQEGAQTVAATISGMKSIQAKVALSAQKVQEMGTRSDQIEVIVATIEDIASQTNLLALNAAIEAARAGEQGKGFAVVADEVRKLAERAAAATKEVSSLVKGIQSTVSDAVAAMAQGSQEVELGVSRANQAGQALEQILTAARGVNRQANEIAAAAERMGQMSDELVAATDAVSAVVEENTAATQQMNAGSAQMGQAIENIASVSEENSAAIEEVSASTEEMTARVAEVTTAAETLADMAVSLQQAVAQFQLTAAQETRTTTRAAHKPAARVVAGPRAVPAPR
jgi:methyl-accepting chemotaxis protein